MASGSGFSGTSRAFIPDDINMSKAKVKRKSTNWSWEDEMLMYDVTQKSVFKQKKLQEKESMTEEMKALIKKKELDMLYQREERKLYVSGLRQTIFFPMLQSLSLVKGNIEKKKDIY